MFRRTLSETGALELTWPRLNATLHAWILLVDPERLDPSGLRPEVLLRELIRVPLPSEPRAIIYVPVGRVIGLALVARDIADRPLEPPPFTITDYRAPSAPAATPPGPIAREPLVFAQAAPADLAAIAQRVANQLSVPAQKVVGPSGFGARQRWYLTRLGFVATEPDAPRVVVLRSQFIGEAELAAWRDAPPADAMSLAPAADAIVDGVTPDEAMAFYAVLEGPAPWRPLTLTPLQPPFEDARAPAFIGECRARLGPLLERAPIDSPQHELLTAALLGCP